MAVRHSLGRRLAMFGQHMGTAGGIAPRVPWAYLANVRDPYDQGPMGFWRKYLETQGLKGIDASGPKSFRFGSQWLTRSKASCA